MAVLLYAVGVSEFNLASVKVMLVPHVWWHYVKFSLDLTCHVIVVDVSVIFTA